MNKFSYSVSKNQPINFVRYSDYTVTPFVGSMQTFDHPINLEEGYVQIIYPQRKEFIEQFTKSNYDPSITFDKIYYPFENRKVEFSSFIHTTHVLKIETEFYINMPSEQEINFELITCGAVQIFVNGESQEFFKAFTRNVASKKNITLKLNSGVNKINVYATELAERDVFFYYELVNKSNVDLDCYILFNGDVDDVKNKLEILTSLYFTQDIYDINDVKVGYDKSLLKNNMDLKIYEARNLLNPVLKNSGKIVENPDVATLELTTNEISLKGILNQEDGVSDICFEIECDDFNPVRKMIYTINTTDQTLPTMDIAERKKYIQKTLLKNSPQNITKALLLLSQGVADDDMYKSIDNGLELIDKKGDCADFQFVPLLWLYTEYKDLLNNKYQDKLKNSIINFRFWIDEPGNDAMWWFSENHAFLFHISQYLSGHIFGNETFTVSGRSGKEQYEIGKKRIIEWFEIFNKYGFAEWNSTTYLPVDLIGFATLYKVAPDEEIRLLAKNGMDAIFKIVDINLHKNIVGCTYGRVYEKELKGLKNGELSLITWIIFGKGFINKSNRASVLLTLTDYTYEQNEKYNVNNKPTIIYKQGKNEVITYTYKTKNYVLSSAINYKPFKKGHQQHMSHVSFSSSEFPLWINNPGETVYSGENRPSFWAGNGINPQNFQHKNVQLMKYDVSSSVVKYMHAYFPIMNFDKYVIKNNKAFALLKDTYIMFATNNEVKLTDKGAVKDRELIFAQEKGLIFTVLSDCDEFSTFEDFIACYDNTKFSSDLVIANNTSYEIKENNFFVNNELVKYEANDVI